MNALLVIHAAVTWVLVGMIWTVQLVHYPLWAQIEGNASRESQAAQNDGAAAFREYHGRHMLRMTLMVAPLVTAEFLTAAALVVCGARGIWLLASFAPMVTNWISTFFAQVPLHARLAMGFDAQTHRRLVSSNWWRTVGWTIRGGGLIAVLLGR